MNGAPIRGVIFKAKKANSQTSAPLRGVQLYLDFDIVDKVISILITKWSIYVDLYSFWLTIEFYYSVQH